MNRSPPETWRVVAPAAPVSVPELWPTMLTWGPDRVHVMVPETEPRTTSNRLPDGTAVGSVPPVVTTIVSASEAQRPSWWFMHTPGPMPVHSLSAVHARQVFVVVLQTGVVPEHVVLSVHCIQAPVVEHAGAEALFAAHWVEAVQAVQVSVVVAQIGVAPEHVELVVHPTHLFVVVSQTSVAPEHVVLSVHCTQAPVAEHAGAAALFAAHWLAAVQAVQVSAAEQTGVAPEHVELMVHPTHLFVVVSQTGVAPEQVVLSVHCTQVPVVEHAGVAGFFAAH